MGIREHSCSFGCDGSFIDGWPFQIPYSPEACVGEGGDEGAVELAPGED